MSNRRREKFKQIFIRNRWKRKKWNRDSTWIPLGFRIRWINPKEISYEVCLFGIDFSFWFHIIEHNNE